MREKYSEWFGPEIKPVRVGVYETYDTSVERGPSLDRTYRRLWDGKKWQVAGNGFQFECNSQKRAWRGLSKKP